MRFSNKALNNRLQQKYSKFEGATPLIYLIRHILGYAKPPFLALLKFSAGYTLSDMIQR